MDDKPLNISKAHIERAAQDKEYLEAFAFALMIKASHRNSMMLNAGTKAISKFLHCSASKAKRIKKLAEQFGLISYDRNNSSHIIANKFERKKKKERTVRFWVHTNDDHSFHIFIKSNIKNKKNYPVQTFANVKKLILSEAILIEIGYHIERLNTCLRSGSSRKTHLRQKEKRCLRIGRSNHVKPTLSDREMGMLNRGYGQELMLKKIFNNQIGEHKLRQLIKFLKSEKLLRVTKNVIPFKKYHDGESSDIDDFYCVDKGTKIHGGEIVDVYSDTTCWCDDKLGKKFLNPLNTILSEDLRYIGEGERVLCRQYANNYTITATHCRWTTRSSKKQKSKQNGRKTEATSTVKLPF